MRGSTITRVVAAVIFNDNKEILLCRKSNLDHYIFPGGKPENGESNIETLRRELKEELNSNFENFYYVSTFLNKAPNGDPLEVIVYRVEIDDINDIHVGAEIVEVRWYDIGNSPTILSYPLTSTSEQVIQFIKENPQI